MTIRSGTLEDATRRTTLLKLRDPDGRKGLMEDERPCGHDDCPGVGRRWVAQR
jgi:hypothetical protein